MPKVGKKHFAYTEAGKKAAAAEREKLREKLADKKKSAKGGKSKKGMK
jgi:hypothetical protein